MRLPVLALLVGSCLNLSAATVKVILNPVSGQITTLKTVARETCKGFLTVVADGKDKGTLSTAGGSLDLGTGKDFEFRTGTLQGEKQDMVLELIGSTGTFRFRLQDDKFTSLGWLDPTNKGQDVFEENRKMLTVKFPQPKS